MAKRRPTRGRPSPQAAGRDTRLRFRRLGAFLAAGAVLLALAFSAWTNLTGATQEWGDSRRHISYSRNVLKVLGQQTQRPAGTRSTAHHIQTRVPGRGNIVLRLEGFPPDMRDFRRSLYYWTVYALHPRRAYVCEPSTWVGALPEAPFAPSEDWMRRHGVVGTGVLSSIGGERVRFLFYPAQQSGPEATDPVDRRPPGGGP